ncbi:hypothetical protein HPULCUR_007303 [Helicostylum pulchrum]|uniref:F-box domain-containing protein n=1 Tax=Helicostylum pulchrum TaxID=562976 RepID=A0ABP9Y5J3_9FUNG
MSFLTPDVILYIADLLNEVNKASFALACQRYWSVCAAPTNHTLVVQKTITALQLRKHSSFVLQREECSTGFALFLLEAVGKKTVTFVVQPALLDLFTIIVKNDKMTNITIIANHQLDQVLCSVDTSLFDCEGYGYWENNFQGDNLIKRTDLNEAEASELIGTYAARLVESIAVLEKYWFFVTSFSAFLHHNAVDDCADQSKTGYQEKAIAFVRTKTALGKEYFEFSIRFGHVEFLAAGGFFGSDLIQMYRDSLAGPLKALNIKTVKLRKQITN